MIDALEASGHLKPLTVLVEPIFGNTGIGLAFVAAARRHRLILAMPDSMSIDRRRIPTYLGAELELAPRKNGMKGAIARAEEIIKPLPDALSPVQFEGAVNPLVHEKTTSEEIWAETGGNAVTHWSMALALVARLPAADACSKRGSPASK